MNETEGLLDYHQALDLEPLELLEYLETAKEPVIIIISGGEEAQQASQLLQVLAKTHAYFSTLLSYAKIEKRTLARKGKGSKYEDMIDKEAIIANAMSSLDLQYKAVSKSLSLYMDEMSSYFK